MIKNLSRNKKYRSTLYQMGLNVYGVSKIGNRRFCVVNVETLMKDISDVVDGIEKDNMHAYYDLFYCEMFHIKPFMQGVLKPTQGRYCPMKLYRVCKESPETKTILTQRLRMINQQLAAASGLYDLRAGEI